MLNVPTLVILISFAIYSSDALQCHAGIPTLGKLTAPNLKNTQCKGPSFEDVCYVMFTDYDDNKYDAWTYGCILKGSLNQCNKSFKKNGVTNNYCCCNTAGCNTKEFAARCGGGNGGGGGGGSSGSVQQSAQIFTLAAAVLFAVVLNFICI